MVLQQANRIRGFLPKLNSVSESLKLNRGAAFIVTSRAMGSEIGSGSGRGGGTGGRLVGGQKKSRWTLKRLSQTIFGEPSGSPKGNISSPSTNSNQRYPHHQNSVREAGGAMGKKGAAQEEQYFANQNKAMKDKLKQHLQDEIKKHEDAIKASKELMREMDK